jgi:hypothetical protein
LAPAGPAGPAGPAAPVAPAGPAGPVGPVAPLSPNSPAGPLTPLGPLGPLGPLMFHEICLAPFRQTKKFMSPDVYRLPFVSGSTHTVMTPLWMPGLLALLAEAIVATAANKSTTAAASHLLDRAFIMTSSLLVSSEDRVVRSGDRLRRSWSGGCSRRTLHRDQRLPAHGYAFVGFPLPPQPRGRVEGHHRESAVSAPPPKGVKVPSGPHRGARGGRLHHERDGPARSVG